MTNENTERLRGIRDHALEHHFVNETDALYLLSQQHAAEATSNDEQASEKEHDIPNGLFTFLLVCGPFAFGVWQGSVAAGFWWFITLMTAMVMADYLNGKE